MRKRDPRSDKGGYPTNFPPAGAPVTPKLLLVCSALEHIPCGAPEITFKVAPFTSFAERGAEATIKTI